MFEKKFGLGIIGAAALAACSPQENTPENPGATADATVSTQEMEALEKTLGSSTSQESVNPDTGLTTEQEIKILSGNTEEVDSMSPEEVEKLTPQE